MTTTDTTAPARYIAKSQHKGDWVKVAMPGTYRIDTFTARELTDMSIPRVATGEFVLWEAGGTRQGDQFFYRTRYVPQADGSLAVYASDGHLVIIHPADRKIRIRTH